MGKQFSDGIDGEFEIQAILYFSLLVMGYRVRGEVHSTTIFPGKKARSARFDLVIFDNEWKPLEIIEAKHPEYSIPFAASRQYARYCLYGIPVRFAKSKSTATTLLAYYKSNLSAYKALYGMNTSSAWGSLAALLK